MKIYVTNIKPSSIKHVFRGDKVLLNKNGFKKYELTSADFGTHIIQYSKNKVEQMYRIEPTVNMDLHLINNYNGYNLLVDLTKYIEIPVVSQFPVNYVLTKMTCFEYCINKNSHLKLVIECLEESNDLLEKEFIPINFYFTFLNSSLNSSLNSLNSSNSMKMDDYLLEEINMFLLELN